MPLRRKNKQVQLLNIKPKGTLYVSQPSGPAAARSQSLNDLSSASDDNIDASRAELSKTPPPPPRGGRPPSPSPSSPRHNIQIIPLMEPRRTLSPDTSSSPVRGRTHTSPSSTLPEKPASKATKQSRPTSMYTSDSSAASAELKDAKTKQRSEHDINTEIKFHSGLGPPQSAVSITFSDDNIDS